MKAPPVSDYDFTKIPFDRIVKLGQIRMVHTDLFTVSWLLGRYCNYKCSYCWKHGRSDEIDHRPTEVCLNTVDEIKRQARERGYNSFAFSLSGGEPTLHPGYLDILDKLANDMENTNYTSIHMTTNMSRGMSWLRKYLDKAVKFSRASITASFHKEYQKDIVKFADKLVFLQDNGINITINTVMVPDNFNILLEDSLYFDSRGINVTLKPQSDPYAMHVVEGYTDEQLKILQTGMPQHQKRVPFMQVEMEDDEGNLWYMDQAERFNAFNFNRFKGWVCDAGYRGIIIREPCGSVKRSYSCVDEPIGNIITGFNLHEVRQPCISETCVSSADSKIPKRKKEYA